MHRLMRDDCADEGKYRIGPTFQSPRSVQEVDIRKLLRPCVAHDEVLEGDVATLRKRLAAILHFTGLHEQYPLDLQDKCVSYSYTQDPASECFQKDFSTAVPLVWKQFLKTVTMRFVWHRIYAEWVP